MNPLTSLLNLPAAEQEERGLVHTPGEIAQQPATWMHTWTRIHARLQEIQSFLMSVGLEEVPDRRPIIYLIGAGTSDYIGHCLQLLLQQKWQCEVVVVSSTDLLIDFSDYILTERPYLWISFSRSGDSPEGVAVLERALAEHPQISHLVVSCNASGKMSQIIEGKSNCLGIVLDDETNDQGLAMTSSFTNMVVAGQALALAWSAAEYDHIVKAMSEAAQAFLPIAAELAEQLATKNFQRACFIGSGVLAGTARESALKLLELTAGKVKTMSQATLALRHGPMAALDQNTLLVSFLSTQQNRQNYEIDLLREIEMKQLVGTSLAVIGCGAPQLPHFKKTLIVAPPHHWAIPDLYRPVIDVLFGQALGLFFSLAEGLTPDSPSPNGTISRVVQPIEIY
ncbi:MAG: SIS domain-containing protein [Acidobacteriaceae bacterium]